ncbi:MAG: diacylglycerol/lipid kinase family protein [Oscillospiraceae bacterium]|nr:diacylglycerol kinase family lipid kinase [Oscillospiraceae bacterium]
MKRIYFIYNPRSGKGTIVSKVTYIINALTEAGYEVTVRPTQKPLDAMETAARICGEKFPEYQFILCSGGDGTLNEVISGVMESEHKLPVAYIPSGTTNDFAHSLNIPDDTEEAVQSVLSGRCVPVDIGSFNDKYFTYIAAFGAFTEVSYETPQQYKNIFGHAAYILEGMKHIKNIHSYNLTVTYDGTTVTDNFIFGMISNTAYVGGLLSMNNFSLDDGMYEVTLIKTPGNPIELQRVFSSLLNISQDIDTEHVLYFKTSDIRIECNSEIMWTIDGEYGGDQRTVHIHNNQKAINFLTKTESIPEIELTR